MLSDAVDGSDAPAEVSVDDGAHVAVTQPNIVEIPADFFNVDVAFERNPSTPEKPPLGLWISDGHAQVSGELLAHLGGEE